jgi:hypothetical protein
MVKMSTMRWTVKSLPDCACVSCARVHAVWCTTYVGRYSSTRTTTVVLYIPWYASVCTLQYSNSNYDLWSRCAMLMPHDSCSHGACSCSCSSAAVLARADTKFRNLVARLLRGSDTAVLLWPWPRALAEKQVFVSRPWKLVQTTGLLKSFKMRARTRFILNFWQRYGCLKM